MIAEDENVGDLGSRDAGFLREHRLRAVLVEADHRGETIWREAAGHAGGDHAICVGGISHYGHAGVVGGDLINDAALGGENFAVVLEQVGAFHAGAAGLGADEQAPVGILETDLRVVGENHALQERESAVVEFHRHALEGFHGFFHGHFEELENHRLIGAEHGAGGDTGQEGVVDLTGSSGHGYANGRFHKGGHSKNQSPALQGKRGR